MAPDTTITSGPRAADPAATPNAVSASQETANSSKVHEDSFSLSPSLGGGNGLSLVKSKETPLERRDAQRPPTALSLSSSFTSGIKPSTPTVPIKPNHLRSGSSRSASRFSEKAIASGSKYRETEHISDAQTSSPATGTVLSNPHTGVTSDSETAKVLHELKSFISSCKDIGTDNRLIKLSSGMNKSIYCLDPRNISNIGCHPDLFRWVLLAATSGISNHKWRAQEAEIATIRRLSAAGISVPKTDFSIQTTQLNGQSAKIVLQEKLNILAEFSKSEPLFLQTLAQIGLSAGQKKKTKEADTLRDDIQKIWNYLLKHDIHDFQACLARENNGTARILIFDPGDPMLSSSYHEKHKFWVKSMAKAVGLTVFEHPES